MFLFKYRLFTERYNVVTEVFENVDYNIIITV